ncbi:hypothetical protein [Caulobacter sp. 602-1]|uniref:hypothetical protein n=1 Tax=Caulobacter sp. 602-1 TaxID=2492472 RepID=UPI000F62E495|nr:hypothetical protein [Caulobacter sp. 602-1]RRN64652.1 hypothetical protein EIK80_11495 [Caulobacter sp. 602-1]
MTITFGTAFRRRSSREIADGTFVVAELGDAFLLCLKGGTQHEALYAVLAQQGSELKGAVPTWVNALGMGSEVCPLEGLHLEFGPGAFQLPVATTAPKNGAIAIDENGGHWLYLKDQNTPGVQYVNLATGEFRAQIGPNRSFFQEWRIVWRESPDHDPVTVASMGSAPHWHVA